VPPEEEDADALRSPLGHTPNGSLGRIRDWIKILSETHIDELSVLERNSFPRLVRRGMQRDQEELEQAKREKEERRRLRRWLTIGGTIFALLQAIAAIVGVIVALHVLGPAAPTIIYQSAPTVAPTLPGGR